MFVTVWLTSKGLVAAALPAALLVTGWLTGLRPVAAPLLGATEIIFYVFYEKIFVMIFYMIF
jgi:hypothetical protein